MAGKSNRRSIRAKSIASGSAEFQALMKQIARNNAHRARQNRGSLTPEQLVKEWQDSLEALVDAHSPKVQLRGEKLIGRVEVISVTPESGCDLRLICGTSSYDVHWTIDVERMQFDLSCTCSHVHLCDHTWLIATTLLEWINDPRSELVARILGEEYADRQLKETLSMLKMLATNAKQFASAWPTVAESDVPLTRYVWDLSLDDYENKLRLRPTLQQEKKTGGWTKGKDITLEAFLKSSRDSWSGVDRQLADVVRQERWQPLRLDVEDALKVLAGSDVVTYERMPCELSMQPLEMIVSEEAGGLLLSTSATDLLLHTDGDADIVDTRYGVLILLKAPHRAIYFHGPPHSGEIVRRFLRERNAIPMEHKEQLLMQLEPLRSCMAVRLPESIAGREEHYAAPLVLMLQLRRNGMLDASLFVQDRMQMLQVPGDGLARRHEVVDGQPVQFVRRLSEELQRAGRMAGDLGLKKAALLNRWSWRIADAEQIGDLLSATGEYVEQNALTVLWHKDSINKFDVIGRLSASNVHVDVSRQRDWFGLNGTCRIGDHEIPLKDLLSGMHGRPTNGLMQIAPGKWAVVAVELREALRRLADVSLESRGKLQLDASAAPVLSALELARVQIDSDKHWDKGLRRLREASEISPEPPVGLNAELRDYQLDGFRWLCRLSHWGIGGILADDMGLGKTIQALALLLTRVESGPALVIAPTSLGFNWQRECERFAPSLTPILFRDAERIELKDKVGEGDLVICSYGLALREADLLKGIQWGTLILDEAQNIKNSNSKTAAQIRTFQADWKIALTGTPMENHLGELWSIFHTVAPGVLGSWEQFRRRFAVPIEKENNSDRRQALSQVIAPFILRRSKKDVLKDLPERSEMNLLVDLSAEERKRYDQLRLTAVGELEEIGDDNMSHDQRFRILQMLTRLRQLSCHVKLVDENWTGTSSKLTVLMEQLEQLKERGNRPLIFSQFTSHLALIREACDQAGITYQYLDGQTPPVKRQEQVEAFQRGEGDAFLISLKAGGSGLNLTAADYVIHMDPWWNPAVEDQATDRAHRIGQTRSVMVYRIIARGTIEEQILKLHDEKRDLVDGVLSGADAAAKLSTSELAELIRQGSESLSAR